MGNGSVNGKGILAGGALIAIALVGWWFDRPQTEIKAKAPTTESAAPKDAASPTPVVQAPQPVTEANDPVNSEGSLDTVDTVNSDTLAPETQTESVANAQDQDAAPLEPELETAQDTVVTSETEASTQMLPVMETARVDADGSAVIAGQAAPGQTVRILIDGGVVAETQADSSGNYAVLFDVEPSDAARVISVAVGDGDAQLVSEQDLIVMPNQVQVAQVEPVAVAATEPVLDLVVSTQDAVESVETATDSGVETRDTQAENVVEVTAADLDAVALAENVAEPVASNASDSETPDNATVPETAAELALTESSKGVQVDEAATEVEANQSSEPQTAPQAAPETKPETQPETQPETPSEPVEEDIAPTVLMASKEGVKVVQSATEATTDVILDAISYSDQGDVTLTGRVAAQSRVQVYVNNTLIAATDADDQGDWNVDLNNVDPGVYTLRIDEVDDASQVISRIEMPFKREDREKLKDQVALDANTPIKNVTVQPGSTLWAIARDRYGEGILYVSVFNANRDKIRDPDLIYPGQIFDLPETITE